VEDRDREKVNLEPTVIRKGVVEKELRDNTKLAGKLAVRSVRWLSRAESS
jgi:hypothetical protein